MISFSFMVGNTIIFCISFDSNSLLDRKLLSRSQARRAWEMGTHERWSHMEVRQ